MTRNERRKSKLEAIAVAQPWAHRPVIGDYVEDGEPTPEGHLSAEERAEQDRIVAKRLEHGLCALTADEMGKLPFRYS